MRRACAVLFLVIIVASSASRAEEHPRPCPPQDWCGCWLATYLDIKDQKLWRELWVARNWMTYGKPADGPAPGVIAVYARGTGGHVGIVTAVRRPGFVVLKSGNDGGMVRERERSTEGVIAWRIPDPGDVRETDLNPAPDRAASASALPARGHSSAPCRRSSCGSPLSARPTAPEKHPS